MKLTVPSGSTFHWNPYTPQFYTVVDPVPIVPSSQHRPAENCPSEMSDSAEERSINPMDDEEWSNMSRPFRSPLTSHYGSTSNSPKLAPVAAPALVMTPPPEIDPNYGYSLIHQLRALAQDAFITQAVELSSTADRDAMLAALLRVPHIATELCLHYRGNVLTQLLALIPHQDTRSLELHRRFLAQLKELAFHQNGTIALIRIYDSAPDAFCREVNALTLSDFQNLAVHPYGNFVASRVIRYVSEKEDAQSAPARRLTELLSNAGVILQLAANKFGSHVLESWNTHCTPSAFLSTAKAVLTNREVVMRLGHDAVANYPLQGLLRRLALDFGPKHKFTVEVSDLLATLADSRFFVNLRKAAQGILPRKKLLQEQHIQ